MTIKVPASRGMILAALRDGVAYNILAEERLRAAGQINSAIIHRTRADSYRRVVQRMTEAQRFAAVEISKREGGP